ncbi:ATP-dependent DNA helicase RecG [soil metagenome]
MASLARLASVGIENVSGLSGARGADLRSGGLRTVADLLHHIPRRYLDRSRIEPIALAPVGEEVTLLARVVSVNTRRPKKMLIVAVVVTDGSSQLAINFFNQKFRAQQLPVGTEAAFSGKIERFRGTRQMNNPQVDLLDSEGLRTGRWVPLHPVVKGVGSGYIRRYIFNALKRSQPIPDPVPTAVTAGLELAARSWAFEKIHFPDDEADVARARRRLVFDELFRLELALALRKRRQIEESRGRSHAVGSELVDRFLKGLPYSLTDAQERVLAEIRADLSAPFPMHRLLQGEVGSGKTVVAVAAMLEAVAAGLQAAVMAPTEVLAIQHFLGIQSLLELASLSPDSEAVRMGMTSLFAAGSDLPVRMALLTSSQARTNYDAKASRVQIKRAIAEGEIDLVIGTHALIQEGVDFADLAVAVVDEQHRFGVGQRVLLKEKATEADPDVLIMTATPIPRTLSMTLYGDLDVSLLDEMPPGRKPTKTRAITKTNEYIAWNMVKQAVAEGHQAFVVCPLVEESAKLELASATVEFGRLTEVFSELRVGLIHGQLSPLEKETEMAAFRAGQIDVLVATTVIEVGIDVPNATVMVIQDADRFGLSQLHQLRGRVGRGSEPGLCILVADPTTEDGQQRLAAMVESTDGFRLAEIDLMLRGQGTVFGARQSGLVDLKVADILSDYEELVAARREAFALVEGDPGLSRHPELVEEIVALLGEQVEWLFKS